MEKRRPEARPFARFCAGRPGRLLCGLLLLVFFGLFNASIAAKENVLANGQRMVLALAPVDPLSLLQGFYMDLDFVAARDILRALSAEDQRDYGYDPDFGFGKRERRGLAVMRERDGLYHFVRLHDARARLAEGERLLAFKVIYGRRAARVQISGGSFFFEEGLADLYSAARFAELRVDGDGAALITGLLDADRRLIEKSESRE